MYNMQQSQNNMITSIDKIPLKPSVNNLNNDDLTDPMVKDVLNEFEKELSLQEKQSKYVINDQPPQQQPLYQPPPLQPQYQPPPVIKKQDTISKNYIVNELITKTFIICIIMAIITNPYIYDTLISKIPENISNIFISYNYIIKLIILFIVIYGMMFYNLI